MSAVSGAGGQDRGAALRSRLERKLVLPTLPSIALELNDACKDPNAGIRDLAALVAKDPPLCARALRIVNSVYVGLREPVLSIEHAVTVLGMDGMQNLVLEASVAKLFEQLANFSSFDVRRLWRHSVLTGRLAFRLSPRARAGLRPEQLELAGLLHDIGKIVLLDLERESYAALVLRAVAAGRPLYQVEREELGFDHCQVGALLARRWKLPQFVETCIASHHDYENARALRLPGVAQLIFVDLLGRAVQLRPQAPPRDLMSFLPARVAAHVRLEQGEVSRLAAYAAEALEKITL